MLPVITNEDNCDGKKSRLYSPTRRMLGYSALLKAIEWTTFREHESITIVL